MKVIINTNTRRRIELETKKPKWLFRQLSKNGVKYKVGNRNIYLPGTAIDTIEFMEDKKC